MNYRVAFTEIMSGEDAVRESGKTMRGALDSLIVRSPLQRFMTKKSGDKLLVLAYHDIQNPTSFRAQIEFVATQMQPVGLSDLLRVLANPRATLPEKAVMVTFDDADRTLVDHGLPILKRYGVPGLAFVVAGYLGVNRPFWWNEARQLMEAGGTAKHLPHRVTRAIPQLKMMPDRERRRAIGRLRATARTGKLEALQLRVSDLETLRAERIDIGNHTMTHPLLDRCSTRKVQSELIRSHRLLREVVGTGPVAFAYPNGNRSLETTNTLRELGYKVGFLFDHRLQRIPILEPLGISRVRVASHTSMERFQTIASGLHPMIHRLRRRS